MFLQKDLVVSIVKFFDFRRYQYTLLLGGSLSAENNTIPISRTSTCPSFLVYIFIDVCKGGPLFILGLKMALKFGFGFYKLANYYKIQKSKPYFRICSVQNAIIFSFSIYVRIVNLWRSLDFKSYFDYKCDLLITLKVPIEWGE